MIMISAIKKATRFLKKLFCTEGRSPDKPGDLGKAIPEGAVDNAQLRDVNEAIRCHAIEQVGKKLRGYMTDMKRIAVAG